MYNIIPLILISLSLFVILVIIARKFPALANLDVESMPAEKEAKFKEQIATSRLKRNLTKWSFSLIKIFRMAGENVGIFFHWVFNKLDEMKKKYNTPSAPESPEEKEIKIKELFLKNENLDNREDFEEKEKNLIKIIEFDGKNVEAFENLGELYFTNKKHEEAKQVFAHILKLLPDDETERQAGIYYDLALVYKETGEEKEALETIKMASRLAPNNPRYLDAMFEISLINGDKFLAGETFDKLKEVNPDNAKLEDFREKIKELEP